MPIDPDRLWAFFRRAQNQIPTALGVFDATWAGGSTTVDVSIPHGLGRTPRLAFVQVQDSGVSGDQTCEILEQNDSAVAVRVTTTGTEPAADDTTPIGWMVW